MVAKKLTAEQEAEIQMLVANNEMLEKTKKEAQDKGRTKAVKQIENAQKEVIEHIKMIDPNADTAIPVKKRTKKVIDQDYLFMSEDNTDIMDLIEETELNNQEMQPAEEIKVEVAKVEKPKTDNTNELERLTPSNSTITEQSTFNDIDPSVQYDVIQLPSNGEPYKSKTDRVPVAYLTAYDENIITSPNLYKDGLVIDFLLKNKIVNSEINVDDLVSGDADAIVLFLRATSYGPEFPIVVNDPETGEQIETVVDLTTLKPKEFKLVGDENGHFEFETPLKKDKIKFRYLTRKQEKQLTKVTELEGFGTKGHMLERERETILTAMLNDKYITETEKKTIKAGLDAVKTWSNKLLEANKSAYTRIMTNNLQLQVVAINGNYDREYIRKYINVMPARDSLALRRYINDNAPGIDFTIEVQRPESLGGGSFKTFLNWDDSVFLNIADV